MSEMGHWSIQSLLLTGVHLFEASEFSFVFSVRLRQPSRKEAR